MKLYLDNCCFNRPYDDQLSFRVRIETEAKLKIQEEIRNGSYQLVWSYILDYENLKNPFQERREQIGKWKAHASVDIVENAKILTLAKELQYKRFKKFDSLHIACAIFANSDYFLTTEPIAKLCGNVAQSPSAVFNLLYFQCFLHDLPSRGRLGYSFAIGSTDDSILKKSKAVDAICIVDPIDLIKEVLK